MDEVDLKNHKYLSYHEINNKKVNFMAQNLLNTYLKSNHSINQLKKLKDIQISYLKDNNPNNEKTSNLISYDKIRQNIKTNKAFHASDFNLFELSCNWLDGEVAISLPQLFVDQKGKTVKMHLNMPYGENFPIKPLLDREGIMYNSFQGAIAQKIIKIHHDLIDRSNEIFDSDWMFDLITLISTTISLLDITLNQLYIKAEHDPFPGWKFDRKVLRERQGRKLVDKLKWVNQITGKSLDNIKDERISLIKLKSVRNHTQHFDPPCFGYTIEDVASWLNLISDIGVLVLKVRNKIGSEGNEKLYEIISLPVVKYNGYVLFNRTRPNNKDVGYITTTWS